MVTVIASVILRMIVRTVTAGRTALTVMTESVCVLVLLGLFFANNSYSSRQSSSRS